jgi:hypothetical protein
MEPNIKLLITLLVAYIPFFWGAWRMTVEEERNMNTIRRYGEDNSL